MNKDFVPYEQALELKELGFDEECFKFFDLNNELEIFETNMFDEDKINSKLPNINDFLYHDELPEFYFCTAPLYQQAINFLYICSNKRIDIELKGSDTHEERIRKIEQGIQDLRNLQNNKSNQ
jgi:hypothetical protein